MEHEIYKGGLDHEIIDLFTQTFTDSEGENEGPIIGSLVKRFLTQTQPNNRRIFLTINKKQVVGGVIFSKISFEKSTANTWLLSPAAVSTSFQGVGIGQSLINYAHKFLKREGVQQVVTYGDINFYSKVGYKPITEKIIPPPLKLTYPEGWLGQSFEAESIKPIKGKSYCVEAINQPELW